ncbi:hypothetical protein RI129_009642 [Pyrocoelia pectoralis]|uniref:Uncharacterized protein n=1 Tax=Pyrocoelia pectoralis TaxID=417401 RepID=A0AAN7V2M2_9COLE
MAVFETSIPVVIRNTFFIPFFWIFFVIGVHSPIRLQLIRSLNSGAISSIPTFELAIIYNEIEVIRKNAFRNLSRLELLYLDHNNIASVESYAFENLPSVKGIYLRNNNIDVIKKDTFVNLPNLENIYINNNKLKKFDQNWFLPTPKLRRLVLHDNQITSLQRAAFQDFRFLITIDFTNNKLRYIHPEVFYGLQLEDLSLGGNELTSFDEVKLSYSSAFYRLEIERNKFTYLSPRFFNEVFNVIDNNSIIFPDAVPAVRDTEGIVYTRKSIAMCVCR